MSLPDEYYVALNGLKSFRRKIFDVIVSGRIKAVLDANHETLEKYKSIIEGFNVTPYMFDVIRRKALALRFDDLHIGTGKVSVLKSKYVAGKARYPIQPVPNVPYRDLPQVDYFIYTPSTDIELIEKSSEHMWGNLFVIQCNRHMFREVPDASNVFYDFYTMRPVGRGKFKAELTSPASGFDSWQYIHGEMVILERSLTPLGSDLTLDYFIFVFVDANVLTSAGETNIVPIVIVVPHSTAGNPEVTLVCAGQRLSSRDEGLHCGWVAEGQFVGFTKTHGGHEPVEFTETWSNISKFFLWFEGFGYLSPPIGLYTKKTTELTTVYAYPHTGWVVRAWDLNGYDFPPSDSFTVYHFRDINLGCIFVRGGTLTIRPNANGDITELYAWGALENWDAVNDVYSDGDATYVHPGGRSGRFRDLYHMTNISLPSGAVIDDVILAVRVRQISNIPSPTPKSVRIILKTHGVVYTGSPVEVNGEWRLVTWKLERNPYTGQRWTQAEVNDLQVGVDLESYYDKFKAWVNYAVCTQLYADVEWRT